MPSKEVGLHEEALAEAQAAYRWYAAQDPVAAEAFIGELDDAIEQIGKFPKLAGPYVFGTRRYVMRRFPFTGIYPDLEEMIEIVAIAHGRRKPGYWRTRVKT
jgi:toxin ParE1/3/4